MGAMVADEGASPYRQLQDALAALVAARLLAPDRVQAAAVTCWSGVHGFATLTSRGPLRALPRSTVDRQAAQLVDDLVRSAITPSDSATGAR